MFVSFRRLFQHGHTCFPLCSIYIYSELSIFLYKKESLCSLVPRFCAVLQKDHYSFDMPADLAYHVAYISLNVKTCDREMICINANPIFGMPEFVGDRFDPIVDE